MKKAFTIIALFVMVTGFSQIAIEQSSISSGGTNITNGSITMLYTIGEVAVNESTQTTTHLSEGFISGVMLTSLGISDDFSLLKGVRIYPNPSSDFVQISFTEKANYTITIIDFLGKNIDEVNTEATGLHTLDISNLSNGMYMIVIQNQTNKLYNTFRILKE